MATGISLVLLPVSVFQTSLVLLPALPPTIHPALHIRSVISRPSPGMGIMPLLMIFLRPGSRFFFFDKLRLLRLHYNFCLLDLLAYLLRHCFSFPAWLDSFSQATTLLGFQQKLDPSAKQI